MPVTVTVSTEQEKREKARRDALYAFLALLMASATGQLHNLVDEHAAGKLTPQAFGLAAFTILANAHGHAAYAGRQLAGSLLPFGPDDAAYGQLVAQEQRQFLDGFVADLANGRYTDANGKLKDRAVLARASLYADRLTATADEAFIAASPLNSTWEWVLGPVKEEHCEDCPIWAAGGPYTLETLPAIPRDGTSQCKSGCHCRLRRGDGVEGFVA